MAQRKKHSCKECRKNDRERIVTPVFDPAFSDHSYDFRPQRRGHDAVRKARPFMQEGYRIVLDIDLEKFFDRVHHDRLMARLSEEITDKPLLKLIRKYLQCGPLNPILSNIVLDELDKELKKRNLRFVLGLNSLRIIVCRKSFEKKRNPSPIHN